jgi:hypothetical protein
MITMEVSMFRARQTAVFLLTAALATACSSTPKNPAPEVPVGGGKSDVKGMTGRWEGTYSSQSTGRSGSIVFELKSGAETAKGDVLMVPKGGNVPASSDPLHGMPQVLNISFVNAEGAVVKGTMDPYTDPDCNCQVETTFVGVQKGDTIEGTFTTTGAATVATGRWSIHRTK